MFLSPSKQGLARALKSIFIGGLIAGILDLIAAFVSAWLRSGTTPRRVTLFIASGALGPAAFTGGNKIVALGVAFHFLIATGAAAVFYLASRKLRFLIEWPIVMGLLYGILVYLFMNFVVLPRSFIRPAAAAPISARIIGALIIMFFVGLPIALVVRRYSK